MDEITTVNGVTTGIAGDALGSDYAPTSSVDLADLSKSWGVQFDSDAIGPSSDTSPDVLTSNKKTAIPDLTTDGSDKADKSDSAISASAGKAVSGITSVITSGGGFRQTQVGKTIGGIGDAVTPVAAAINPIAGIVAAGVFGVAGAVGDSIASEQALHNQPVLKTRAWGSDIGITPPIAGVEVKAPNAVVYGVDPKPVPVVTQQPKTDLQRTYMEYGFYIPGQ